jgi:hypothetical protein
MLSGRRHLFEHVGNVSARYRSSFPVMLKTSKSDPADPAEQWRLDVVRSEKTCLSAVAPRGDMLDKSPMSMHRLQVNYRPVERAGQIEQNPSKLMTRVRFPSPAPSLKSTTCMEIEWS